MQNTWWVLWLQYGQLLLGCTRNIFFVCKSISGTYLTLGVTRVTETTVGKITKCILSIFIAYTHRSKLLLVWRLSHWINTWVVPICLYAMCIKVLLHWPKNERGSDMCPTFVTVYSHSTKSECESDTTNTRKSWCVNSMCRLHWVS